MLNLRHGESFTKCTIMVVYYHQLYERLTKKANRLDQGEFKTEIPSSSTLIIPDLVPRL